jgi:uncharacterized protein YgiM (DUF1202 family)
VSNNSIGRYIKPIIIIGIILFIIWRCSSNNTGSNSTSGKVYQSQTNTAPSYGTVTSSALNVRGGPSVNYRIFGKIYQNNRVEILELYNNGWAKIKFGNGTGYVNAKYLSR